MSFVSKIVFWGEDDANRIFENLQRWRSKGKFISNYDEKVFKKCSQKVVVFCISIRVVQTETDRVRCIIICEEGLQTVFISALLNNICTDNASKASFPRMLQSVD